MQNANTRYRPVDNGYGITGSREFYNRILYGSHAEDEKSERFFTFAGDLPLFAGAVVDWQRSPYSGYCKNGYLLSGLALTPGMKTPAHYSSDVDLTSHWLHDSEDTVAVFRRGTMEYELQQFSPWFPEVRVKLTILPLHPEDGFLVEYNIKTDQRVIFCLGFGGITEKLFRFEYPRLKERHLSAEDCRDNNVICGINRAEIKGLGNTSLLIGTTFPTDVSVGDAKVLSAGVPSEFLEKNQEVSDLPVARFSCTIEPGETLCGSVVVIRNSDHKTLDKWLKYEKPAQIIKCQIQEKLSSAVMKTPDRMLDLTLDPVLLAMDASWHKNSFHHGTTIYHCPYLGWRSWYGPTVIGWHDRVEETVRTHYADIAEESSGDEEVWYDGKNRPNLDHEGSQYHQIKNSSGYIPCFLGGHDIYNMQEVAADMLLHYLQWTGDLELADEIFEKTAGVLDWEKRILDPDNDGLYQNFLNTWISDGHSYNGAGCTQASSYNYYANLMLALLAEKTGRDGTIFKKQAEKIYKSVQSKLWVEEKGVPAEHIDTVGNCLRHESPELSTIYLAIESGILDRFQTYRSLRFTETELKNTKTSARGHRQVYSSNWYPKKYSTCGIFPAENLHLALVYFKTGQSEKGMDLLSAVVDSHFSGKNPGMARHILTAAGSSDSGCIDFTDVSSMYLRTIVEGLFGIRFRLLENEIEIAPGFPAEWGNASIELSDISLNYFRSGRDENLTMFCSREAVKILKLPMRSSVVDSVYVNGKAVDWQIEPGIGKCFLTVKVEDEEKIHLRVIYGNAPLPQIKYEQEVISGNKFIAELCSGKIAEFVDSAKVIKDAVVSENAVKGTVDSERGSSTIFVKVSKNDFCAWLPIDLTIRDFTLKSNDCSNAGAMQFKPFDISRYFNDSLTEIHNKEFLSPRPSGYSIGVKLNGRYAWDWNQGGHNALIVDDSLLRSVQGSFRTNSGLEFSTPSSGNNVCCVSVWDNYESEVKIPLTGKAEALAVFFIMTTNAMQSRVENARFTVNYKDGTKEVIKLVNPLNTDDWLTAAVQQSNESFYFSEFNHGIVQRVVLDSEKELADLTALAIANEVILGIVGISILTEKD
ncbi:MAG: DUF4450 domain-containing protein [Planctomycetota bacterium]|jgi:hypothetical protein